MFVWFGTLKILDSPEGEKEQVFYLDQGDLYVLKVEPNDKRIALSIANSSTSILLGLFR